MIFGNKYNPPEKPDNLAKNEEKAVPLQANLQVYIPPKKKVMIYKLTQIHYQMQAEIYPDVSGRGDITLF